MDGRQVGLQLLAVTLQRMDIAKDKTDGIIEFMGNAGHQASQGSHFFRLHQLLLRFLQFPVGLIQSLVGTLRIKRCASSRAAFSCSSSTW